MKIIRQSLSHMHLLTTVCVPMRLSHAITFLNWQQKMMNSSYQFLRQLWWYPRVSFSNMNRFPEKEGVLHLYLRKDPEMSTCTDSKTPVELRHTPLYLHRTIHKHGIHSWRRGLQSLSLSLSLEDTTVSELTAAPQFPKRSCVHLCPAQLNVPVPRNY